MRSGNCISFAFLMGATMSFAAAVMAAELPREGSYSGAFSCFGTYRATPVGAERLLVAFDENCLSLSNGILDHVTWHCWGTTDYTNGTGQGQGYCVGNDPDGDRLAANFGPDEPHTPHQKTWKSPSTLMAGTGKFAGIRGSGTYMNHANEFRPMADGTFVNYVTFEGSYKLP